MALFKDPHASQMLKYCYLKSLLLFVDYISGPIMSSKKKEKNKHRKQKETNKVNQKGNYKAWSEDDMAAAVTDVKNGNMSQREASEAFKVPRSSLQDRLAGK